MIVGNHLFERLRMGFADFNNLVEPHCYSIVMAGLFSYNAVSIVTDEDLCG